MNESKQAGTCPRCGASLGADAPAGLCARCLLALPLSTPTEGFDSKTEPPPSIAEIAALFPQFEVLEFLGRGGMGFVYKARQPKLNRIVALKILAAGDPRSIRFAERFQREAQALAQLNHPNIVAVHDFGESGGRWFLAMEFVDGVNLRELLRAQKIKPGEALAIVPPICEALQYAHSRGIVHRDIKPENILLDKQGRVKIADFGIAKILGPARSETLTADRETMGTPHYMAPEQVERPATVDHRADIYSLGVVFYEMLTGELPLGRFQPPSAKVHIDVRLDEVVLRALEKEPERRYQQAEEIKTTMQTIASTPQTSHRGLFIGMTVGATAAAVVLFVVLWLPWMRHASQMGRSSSAEKLSQSGWQLFQQGDFAKARDTFSDALKDDPQNAGAWAGLGWAQLDSGSQQAAETNFLKALALYPDQPGALNGLGQLYLIQRKYDKAEPYLLKAAPQASAAWMGLAKLYLAQDKFDDALSWAQKLVDSGQAGDVGQQLLQAAKTRQVSPELRRTLGIQ